MPLATPEPLARGRRARRRPGRTPWRSPRPPQLAAPRMLLGGTSRNTTVAVARAIAVEPPQSVRYNGGTTVGPRCEWSILVLEINCPCDHRRCAPAQVLADTPWRRARPTRTSLNPESFSDRRSSLVSRSRLTTALDDDGSPARICLGAVRHGEVSSALNLPSPAPKTAPIAGRRPNEAQRYSRRSEAIFDQRRQVSETGGLVPDQRMNRLRQEPPAKRGA